MELKYSITIKNNTQRGKERKEERERIEKYLYYTKKKYVNYIAGASGQPTMVAMKHLKTDY